MELMFPKPKKRRRKLNMDRNPRVHCEAYLRLIRQLPCLVCLAFPPANGLNEAAHVRFGDDLWMKHHTGMAEKPDDKWTVPLCQACHIEQHRQNERLFWERQKIDVLQTCVDLDNIYILTSLEHETIEKMTRQIHWANLGVKA